MQSDDWFEEIKYAILEERTARLSNETSETSVLVILLAQALKSSGNSIHDKVVSLMMSSASFSEA